MLTFDEPQMREQLQQLAPRARIAFAAACAERLMPSYTVYGGLHGVGNPQTLRSALDNVWQVARGETVSLDSAKVFDDCAALVPGDDEAENEGVEAAEDAAAAVVYAISVTKVFDAQDVLSCARRVYEALDTYVSNALGVEGEVALLAHPLIQNEFARQRRDLEELAQAGSDVSTAADRLRIRAVSEGRHLFNYVN